jgi:branched-chain amino acid transport system permease protein
VSLQNYLAPLGSWVLIVQGAIFILCVLLFRDGIMGLVARAWLALTRAKKES